MNFTLKYSKNVGWWVDRPCGYFFCGYYDTKQQAMEKFKMQVEIHFEDWFEDDARKPTTNDEWVDFFSRHLFVDSSVIGMDDDLVRLRKIIVTTDEL